MKTRKSSGDFKRMAGRGSGGDAVGEIFEILAHERSELGRSFFGLGLGDRGAVAGAQARGDLTRATGGTGAAEKGVFALAGTAGIAGAGGAAHLPGMIAAKTVVPVLGVPVESRVLRGVDSLLSMVQMPAGIPVGTLAIGRAGATNAALLAAAFLGNKYPAIRAALEAWRTAQTDAVLAVPDPRSDVAPPHP